ncbi:Anthranilate O-methyltransferase 2 [Dichanthelium oligosanthes]|uniref:Anthranilate O-methyltransferase 2 n=1 Tax=Dichanthelium oligosanthes TaxID=888268 RepID=A0A1E5UX85_9POAL|nr:Anthranilate O-methyltransferase 2 [Dichanthelium oligosanthes]
MLWKAVTEVYMALSSSTIVIADPGCSSGPNALLFLSGVIRVIEDHCKRIGCHPPLELHFFLNDLPKNDFNNLFQSLEQIKKMVVHSASNHGGETIVTPPYYVIGVPGSFYTRLFPCHGVHFFCSS